MLGDTINLKRGDIIDLKCTNPNYLQVTNDLFKFSSVGSSKRKVQFIDRETYLKSKDSLSVSYYKTRCGKCLACRLYKGYTWSNRLQAEAKKWNYSYFITLTFNDLNIEKVDLKKPNREIQLFMKRLRKKFNGLKFKYYAVSELGGDSLRFHYHLILFSDYHIFDDWYIYKKTPKAIYYISPTLNSIWKNGYCPLTFAEGNSMRYTANYVNKGGYISHCFSLGLGSDYISNFDGNLYLVNGNFSPIPRFIKLKKAKFGVLVIPKLELEKARFLESFSVAFKYNKDREEILEKNFFRKKL